MSAPRPCLYKVRWSTEHASGELPYEYVGLSLALEAGHDWEAEMVAIDGNQPIAAIEYQWEVIRVDPPIPKTPHEETPHEHDRQD
jgi:hypothetical protein